MIGMENRVMVGRKEKRINIIKIELIGFNDLVVGGF